MKDDDTLTTGAMLLGSGVAGYALGRFVIERWLGGPVTSAPAAPAVPVAAAPALPAAPAAPAPMPLPPPTAPMPVPAVRPTTQTRPAPAPARPRPRPAPDRDPDAGPITSPEQLDATAAALSGDVGLASSPTATPGADRDTEADMAARRPSRRFDRIFDMYRASIPIEFLRALAKRESNLNPEERKGPAWGLMQIVEVVRKDYNQAHGTRYTRDDLLDPAINVAMACWLLRFIIAQYAKHQDGVPNLRADWNNPRFAELLVYGWNAGFSASGGVIKVVRYLRARGVTDITIDGVFQHARAAGAVRHLSNVDKVRWSKSVVRLYQQARAAPRTAPAALS